MESLETRILGVSVKAFLTLICFIATTVGTGVGAYHSLVKQIDEIRWRKESDDRVNELEIETLKTTVKAIQTKQEYLEQRINRNAKTIEEK